MANAQQSSGFAPHDPNDGRERGEWISRYEDDAKKQIRIEVFCVAPFLFLVPILLFFVWQGFPKNWFLVDEQRYATFARYCYAWLGGTLGGTVFDLKWLIHTVAKGTWNLDRRLWRVLTPHISGGLAFIVTVLMSAGMFGSVASEKLIRAPFIVAVSILAGYFSDRVVGKLAEIADTLFGSTTRERQPAVRELKPPEVGKKPPAQSR